MLRGQTIPLRVSSVGFWITSLIVLGAILWMCIYFAGWMLGWWADHSSATLSAVGQWGLGALIPAVGGLFVWNKINVEAHASRQTAWEKAIRVAPRIMYTPKDNAVRPVKVIVYLSNPEGPTLRNLTLGIASTNHVKYSEFHLLGEGRQFAVTFEFPHKIANQHKNQSFKEQRKRATEYLAPLVRAAFDVDGYSFIRTNGSCRLESASDQIVRNEVATLKDLALQTTT